MQREVKRKRVPPPEDLQVRVSRGTPKEAARPMLGQTFSQEEERGDIPPPRTPVDADTDADCGHAGPHVSGLPQRRESGAGK